MESLFRVVSAADLASAIASGFVPRCPSDERSNCVHLNIRCDVETVASMYFTPDEAPVALEIRRSDIEDDLTFAPSVAGKPFSQITLARPNVLLSSVVAVHPLIVVVSNNSPTFKFTAGALQFIQAEPASSLR